MKIYKVMVADGGTFSRAWCSKSFVSEAKAKKHEETLRTGPYRYYAANTVFIEEEEIEE